LSVTTFPPIGDYAFLSNCEQSCLIAPDGAVEWLCLPRPDSPSVFGALLDRTAGSFRFGPANAQVPQNRRYVPGTMVLETTWQTPTGWLTVHDLLVMGPTRRDKRRDDYYRAPADEGAVGVLLRLATCIGGRVEVLVNCVPRFNYGTTGGKWSYRGDGYESMSVTPRDGGLPLHIAGNVQLGVLAPAVTAARRSPRGRPPSSACPGENPAFLAATKRPSTSCTARSASGGTG
jgi:alpha,alpha-trehalase